MPMQPDYIERTRQQLVAMGWLGDAQPEAERIVFNMQAAIDKQMAARATAAKQDLARLRTLMLEAIGAGYFVINGAGADAEAHHARALVAAGWLGELTDAWAESQQ